MAVFLGKRTSISAFSYLRHAYPKQNTSNCSSISIINVYWMNYIICVFVEKKKHTFFKILFPHKKKHLYFYFFHSAVSGNSTAKNNRNNSEHLVNMQKCSRNWQNAYIRWQKPKNRHFSSLNYILSHFS